jgi:hypothetical protein
MTNVSHNVTHCQELSDAGNDLRIHDLFYRLKPQGSEPCTDEDYMFGVWHSGARLFKKDEANFSQSLLEYDLVTS